MLQYNCYWQPTLCINTAAVNQIFIKIRSNVVNISITVLKLKYLQTTTLTKNDVLKLKLKNK